MGLKLLLCALALGGLLASPSSAQVIADTIILPDTFGPLPGPLHVTYDDNPAHARLYIGGEADGGGVLVVDPLTCEKLARIATGPVSDVAANVPRAGTANSSAKTFFVHTEATYPSRYRRSR